MTVYSFFWTGSHHTGCAINWWLPRPGQVVHYHNLKLGTQNEPVDQAVESAFQGRARVIDASCLTKIGCPLHTLTSIAQAYGHVRHDVASTERVREAI
ncbi:hypothetical protein [Ruegeria sp. Ofav3-42]|uniref:hypothetical protein n=1 Tax=Ruegeria sp. Ofav3-42 TaxID=2917759 RepID=UPI001EF54B1B|nr:hypothetical protein [Ruegeria sp. Ofav3-42]MCG7519172.1 hypothetical protein [Ruegeria sp. Ofav3-42]